MTDFPNWRIHGGAKESLKMVEGRSKNLESVGDELKVGDTKGF